MIDSHCHLDSREYTGQVDSFVAQAKSAGVNTLVSIGADLDSSERAVAITDKFDSVYATVGVHPHDAKTLNDSVLKRLRELTKNKKVVAIGEIGLDYYRDLSPRPIQKEAFHKQLQLAVELAMPIVIHTRESFADTVAIVREYASRLRGGVFHCFPGTPDEAQQVFDLGFVISVGGVITYNNSQMAKTAAAVPLDKIMLETDSPYLTPVPHRGKTNQPAYVTFVRDKLAELRGISSEEVERTTDKVTHRVYRLDQAFEG